MGERRYKTLLCLIQVASVHGYFIIDPIEIADLSPFVGLVNDPAIVKITHAGENDYRILSQQFGATPKNLFDTQIAAGFAGYRYPISFRQLVESQLSIRLDKGMAVTDWEKRPIPNNQLLYALNDVVPLYDLYQQLQVKLEEVGHLDWMLSECKRYEAPGFFLVDYDQ